MDKLRKALEEHRNRLVITCEESCLCWDIDEYLDEAQQSVKEENACKICSSPAVDKDGYCSACPQGLDNEPYIAIMKLIKRVDDYH